jgi:hypothetical protein
METSPHHLSDADLDRALRAARLEKRMPPSGGFLRLAERIEEGRQTRFFHRLTWAGVAAAAADRPSRPRLAGRLSKERVPDDRTGRRVHDLADGWSYPMPGE